MSIVQEDIFSLATAGEEVVYHDHFHTIHRELCLIEENAQWNDQVLHQLHLYKSELRFHDRFSRWVVACRKFTDFTSPAEKKFRRIWSQLPNDISQRIGGSVSNWDMFACELDINLEDSKLVIEECCKGLLSSSNDKTLQSSTQFDESLIFSVDAIISNLRDLLAYKATETDPPNYYKTLEFWLVFLWNYLKVTERCVYNEDFQILKYCTYLFANNAICQRFLYWVKKTAGEYNANEMELMISDILVRIESCRIHVMASYFPDLRYNTSIKDDVLIYELNCMLCDLLLRIKSCTLDVTNVYFGTLKSMRLQGWKTHLLGQTVESLVDLLLEKLVIVEDFQTLRDELIFFLAFLADPPIENANDDEITLVLHKIDALLLERWHLISSVDIKNFVEKEVHNFQQEIEIVNARIRQRYFKYQYSSIHDFPRIIGQGFLDFLLQNLKEKLISNTKLVPFVKYNIWKIEEELVSIRPFFNDTLEQQNDTRLQLIDLAYLTERVVNSCFVFDYPIWYHMACLHDVLEKIKDVTTKIEHAKGFNVYNAGVLPFSGNSPSIPSKQAWTSDINQLVVGFEEDANTIIDELIFGHKSLDIVSIVGMAGLGKTTLARKVYGTPTVKSHFHIVAFCSVSQDYNVKRLLLDILSNIIVLDDISVKDDLPHRLWKCLKGRRYLIVMDDMWDVRAWNDIKSSFPDDQNGSRVMLTTRCHKVAREAQLKYSPFHLGFLSEDNSWELLQKKIFPNGCCPSDIYDVGKLIAKNCKGLPLAVVLISGLLAKTKCSRSWWSEIANRVVSYVSEEGCIKMLEFSYNCLPEYLKPLLLYFGAFPEDTSISMKSLMHLWIDEGFVRESNTKSLEDTAKDYLHDLVDRSLIIVTGRSSDWGIKTIGIHDLIHDFCRTKVKAENFFQLSHENASLVLQTTRYIVIIVFARRRLELHHLIIRMSR